MGELVKAAAVKSWRTTLTGVMGFLAVLCTELPKALDDNPLTVPEWGLVVAGALVMLGLGAARDNQVTSEAAGAK